MKLEINASYSLDFSEVPIVNLEDDKELEKIKKNLKDHMNNMIDEKVKEIKEKAINTRLEREGKVPNNPNVPDSPPPVQPDTPNNSKSKKKSTKRSK
jgi:hypothetical protein